MRIPTVRSYGRYQSDAYGAHTLMVDFGRLTLYYSYRTVVAFYSPERGLVCSKNVWGVTTGKHLNWIQPQHDRRIDRLEFEMQLADTLKRYDWEGQDANL